MFKNPDLFWSQFSDISTEKAVQLQKWGFLKDTFACHHQIGVACLSGLSHL